MSRFLRYLRIVFSATCLIACVLLIVLWVRSYWWYDIYAFESSGNHTYVFLVSSADGVINTVGIPNDGALFHCSILADLSSAPKTGVMSGVTTFELVSTGQRTDISFPHWFPIFLLALLAGIPWLPWWSNRFSLRTLLIATTLVALMLGLIVWISR